MDEQEIDDLRDDMNEDEMEILQREEEFAHHPHQSTQPEDNVDVPVLTDHEDNDSNDDVEEELDDLESDDEYDVYDEDDSEIENENDAESENEDQNNVELTGVERRSVRTRQPVRRLDPNPREKNYQETNPSITQRRNFASVVKNGDDIGWKKTVMDLFGPYNPLSRVMNGIQIETWSISKGSRSQRILHAAISSPSYFYFSAP